MPRKPRFYLPDIPVQVVQRGNNREPIFFRNDDYVAYLGWLKEGAERYQCKIHAYILMRNHVHILVTPKEKDTISRMMQYIGRRYVPYVNSQYGRSGTLWEGRYKGSLVQADTYLMACMRYMELNPVRTKLAKTAASYPWSSYHYNASGRKNNLLTPHKQYLTLGNDDVSRRTAYKALFRQPIDAETLQAIRLAWQSGTPLGNQRFKLKIERILNTKVGYSKQGRPRK
jgi:putative transposase